MIFCPKCGEAIPDKSEVCPKCGVDLKSGNDSQAVVYASQLTVESMSSSNQPQTKSLSKIPKPVIIVIVAVVIAAVIFLILHEIGKANLKKELLRDWMDLDDSIIKVLDFSDDKVEYRLETGYSWMDTTIGKYDYKVVNSDTIKIKIFGDKYETYKIEFNDDRNMITVTPAITSIDSTEHWFNFDD